MKLTKTQQEFIKDTATHCEVPESWQTKVRQVFPKLFKEDGSKGRLHEAMAKYSSGDTYISAYSGCIYVVKDITNISLDEVNDVRDNGTGGFLYARGEWATIIETITKEQAEKELGKTIID